MEAEQEGQVGKCRGKAAARASDGPCTGLLRNFEEPFLPEGGSCRTLIAEEGLVKPRKKHSKPEARKSHYRLHRAPLKKWE